MSALSAAIVQFFSALTTLFSAFDKVAKTIDNIATVGEQSSAQYMDEATERRKQQRAQLEAQTRAAIALANNPSTPTGITST
jgi:hypothetical protein